jgi:hypothetical protein
MDRSGPKFAIQLEPHQHPNIQLSASEVLASKKTNIEMADGSTRKVVLFFRPESASVLKNLQEKGLADSSAATGQRLKKFLSAQGNDDNAIEKAFKHIRELIYENKKRTLGIAREIALQNRSKLPEEPSSKPAQRRRSVAQKAAGQIESIWEKNFAMPTMPFGQVDSFFSKGLKDGTVIRVDANLQVQQAAKPRSTSTRAPVDRRVSTPIDQHIGGATNMTTKAGVLPIPPSGMPELPSLPTGSASAAVLPAKKQPDDA